MGIPIIGEEMLGWEGGEGHRQRPQASGEVNQMIMAL